MSHFTVIDIALKNRAALLAALDALGYAGKVEVHTSPVPLIGYDGTGRELNGTAVTAEIVIRRQHLWSAANDIGFARQPDGTYRLYLSEYDARVQPTWAKRLKQEYGIASSVAALKKKGCAVTVERSGPKVVVRGVRYA